MVAVCVPVREGPLFDNGTWEVITWDALIESGLPGEGQCDQRIQLRETCNQPILEIALVSSRSRVSACLHLIDGCQATESKWGMPGHTEAMKAVVSCDKPGGAAHTH